MEHLDAFWSTLNTCPIGVNEEFVKLSVAISCHTLKQKEMHSNLAKQGNQAIMFGRTVWLELLSCPTSLSSTRRNLIQLNFPSAPSVHVVVYECMNVYGVLAVSCCISVFWWVSVGNRSKIPKSRILKWSHQVSHTNLCDVSLGYFGALQHSSTLIESHRDHRGPVTSNCQANVNVYISPPRTVADAGLDRHVNHAMLQEQRNVASLSIQTSSTSVLKVLSIWQFLGVSWIYIRYFFADHW
jgi:hypothetical protein